MLNLIISLQIALVRGTLAQSRESIARSILSILNVAWQMKAHISIHQQTSMDCRGAPCSKSSRILGRTLRATHP